jgi:hypothetical protein
MDKIILVEHSHFVRMLSKMPISDFAKCLTYPPLNLQLPYWPNIWFRTLPSPIYQQVGTVEGDYEILAVPMLWVFVTYIVPHLI